MMNALSLRFLLVILFVLLTGWSIGASLPVVAGLAGIAATLTARRLFAARQTPVPTPGPFRPPSPGRLSLDDLQHAALIIDPAEDVVARNFQAQDLLGGSVGDPVRLVLRHPMALEGARAAMTSDEAIEREVSGIGRADNIHHLHATRLGDGRVLLTLADISQVRAAERMRVDFVANASHELRTPLATVAGFVETLQGPAAD
ncbi:MAG: histidine kinase dimerization/phospho-acceptor domain-containing protein, partial [Pseudomonadota bacterium]